MKTTIFTLSTLLTLTTAHFELLSPTPRGFDENNLPQFPCGGQNSVTARTPFPLTSASVVVDLGHSETDLEVLIAIGNNPGSAFNTIIRAPFSAVGLGKFCIDKLTFPSSLNLTVGTNATIQVQSNGDPDGGLYNCADITFVETLALDCPTSQIQVGAATNSGHPNGTAFSQGSETTTPSGAASGTASGTATGTATGASASTTPSQTRAPGAGSAVSASMGGLVLAAAGVFALVL